MKIMESKDLQETVLRLQKQSGSTFTLTIFSLREVFPTKLEIGLCRGLIF